MYSTHICNGNTSSFSSRDTIRARSASIRWLFVTGTKPGQSSNHLELDGNAIDGDPLRHELHPDRALEVFREVVVVKPRDQVALPDAAIPQENHLLQSGGLVVSHLQEDTRQAAKYSCLFAVLRRSIGFSLHASKRNGTSSRMPPQLPSYLCTKPVLCHIHERRVAREKKGGRIFMVWGGS